MQSGENMENM